MSVLLPWAVLAVWALRICVLSVNLRAFPVLAPAGGDATLGRVSLLVPARDEEATLRETLRGLLAQPADEILVLNDHSRDGTGALLAAAARDHPTLRVLEGAPLPEGWIGKNWACHQLAEAAQGDVLVFADADVRWQEGALPALVAEMARQGADAFSVFPRQRMGSLGERAVLPLIDETLLSFLPFALLERDVPSAAAAHGAVFAFRRDAYRRTGGHAALRGEILEDVRMAQRVRRVGARLGLALGGPMLGIRMYHGYAQLVRGMGKSLRAIHGDARLLVVLGAVANLAMYTAPFVLAPLDLRWLPAAALALLSRALVDAKTGRGSLAELALVPFAPLLALPAYALGLRRQRHWKGRVYA
ncbi:MAG: glycosyltransferase family 2 protein [Trueperaceae bacterium]|nr:glycosyltransferase family 2 protein [Trueperaceae bacterium]